MDIDDNTFDLYIRSGAFVLMAYACNHWLHHIGNVVKKDLQELTNDIGFLIDKRANRYFVSSAIVSKSQNAEHSQPPALTEKMDRILGSARAFSKERKRDLSFNDGKLERPTSTRVTRLNPC